MQVVEENVFFGQPWLTCNALIRISCVLSIPAIKVWVKRTLLKRSRYIYSSPAHSIANCTINFDSLCSFKFDQISLPTNFAQYLVIVPFFNIPRSSNPPFHIPKIAIFGRRFDLASFHAPRTKFGFYIFSFRGYGGICS